MQVTFLGTGAAMPTGERSQTGLLLAAPAVDEQRARIATGVGDRKSVV